MTIRRTFLVASALLSLVGLATATWLALEDPLAPCPALVILNGEVPARANEAARLYHAGLAREVWLTNSPQDSDSRGDIGTLDNIARLIATGVATTVIHIVPGEALGTRRELAAVAAELRRRRLPCAIAVTSPPHGARVKATWWSRVGMTPRLIVRHAPEATYAGWRIMGREAAYTLVTVLGLER